MLHAHTEASVIPEDPKTFSEASTVVTAGLPGALSSPHGSGDALQNSRTVSLTPRLKAGKERPVSQTKEIC